MGTAVELLPGSIIIFWTVYECRMKAGMRDVQRIKRGNYTAPQIANEEKKKLEAGMSDKWALDNEGRFIFDGPKSETRWFFSKRRKIVVKR